MSTSVRREFTRTIPALSMAISVPAAIAMPTSAAAKAGESFIPSPKKKYAKIMHAKIFY